MKGIEVSPNFEYLDTLPPEEYNKIEMQYLEFVQKAIIDAEDNYCKKKGLTKKEIMKDYNSYRNMTNAVNKRKLIKKLTKDLMGFNKMLRYTLHKEKEQ